MRTFPSAYEGIKTTLGILQLVWYLAMSLTLCAARLEVTKTGIFKNLLSSWTNSSQSTHGSGLAVNALRVSVLYNSLSWVLRNLPRKFSAHTYIDIGILWTCIMPTYSFLAWFYFLFSNILYTSFEVDKYFWDLGTEQTLEDSCTPDVCAYFCICIHRLRMRICYFDTYHIII